LGQIRAALQAEFAAIQNAGPPGSTAIAEDVREQVRMRIARVLRSVLTPEQYKKFEDMARRRPGGPRRATLWTYKDGAFWPNEVRLGLADGSVTEVTEGLPEGANVVVRVREATP
jgi:hypothetical protein